MVQSGPTLEERLRSIVLEEGWLVEILEAVRDISLPDWLVAAGAIRTTVWDRLHGFTPPSRLDDVDVMFFDSREQIDEFNVAERLGGVLPHYRWDVVNQATIHRWIRSEFGITVRPFTSTSAGVASFAETATAVGVRLEPDDQLTIVCPVGLEDLFDLVLRPNRRCADPSAFQTRLRNKDFLARWPNVRVSRSL